MATHLYAARETAHELLDQLAHYTTRSEIAGSIRRLKPEVKDIELVVSPRGTHTTDLFGHSQPTTTTPLHARLDAMLAAGAITQQPSTIEAPRWGQRYRRFWYGGIAVDLFIVLPPASWGSTMLIRTGPSLFSHRCVTPTTDHVTTPQGSRYRGLMPPWLRHADGHYSRLDGTEHYSDINEQEAFTLLGLEYQEPQLRGIVEPTRLRTTAPHP